MTSSKPPTIRIPATSVVTDGLSLYTAIGVVSVMLVKGRGHGAVAWSLTWRQFGVLIASAFAGIAITHVTVSCSTRNGD